MCDSAIKLNDFEAMSRRIPLGAQLASRWVKVVGMAVLGLASGCVVTDPIEFERPANSPPQFVIDRSDKIQPGSIQYVRASSNPNSWTFPFVVRDADVKQKLEVRWRIFSGMTGDRKLTQTIPATGLELREFSINVDRGDLMVDSCHRVEIGVSGSFDRPSDGIDDDFSGQSIYDYDEPFDFDLFSFWIWEGDPNASDPANLVATCATGVIEPPVTTGTSATSEELP